MATKALALTSRQLFCKQIKPFRKRWMEQPLASSRYSTDSPQNSRPETVHAPRLTDIGTRSIFNADHDIFRQTVRKFLQEEMLTRQNEYEEAGVISKDVWRRAGELGLLGVNTPADLGGIGADFLTAAIVIEEVSYANFNAFGGTAVHSDIVMPYICHYGNSEQIKRYIPDMTAGKIIGAIAMTEPGAGSDLQGIKTNAKQDGTDWILNGSKTFITNGINSDVVIVVARTDPGAKSAAHGISLFLVDADTEGFARGRNLKKIGLKAGDTAELFFDNVRLSQDSVLGKPHKGFYYLMQELPQERLTIALLAVAHCEFMFEETRNYVKDRKVFGKPLTRMQTIQHKLAELKTRTCVARTFVDRCLELHNNGQLDSQLASMAKWWTTELQTQVADQCVQLHGGWGYMMEMPISRAFVDARAQTIYGGTNEIMKELIARSIVSDD